MLVNDASFISTPKSTLQINSYYILPDRQGKSSTTIATTVRYSKVRTAPLLISLPNSWAGRL